MIAEDAPAQVIDRGRRRDGGSSFTIVRMRHDHEVEETGHEPHSGGKPANLMLWHLADALGSLTRYSLGILLGAAANIRGAVFLRRGGERTGCSPPLPAARWRPR
jgi:hypothetical protein